MPEPKKGCRAMNHIYGHSFAWLVQSSYRGSEGQQLTEVAKERVQESKKRETAPFQHKIKRRAQIDGK